MGVLPQGIMIDRRLMLRLLPIIAIALLLAACDPESSLAVANRSDATYVVLLVDRDPEYGDRRRAWRVGPHSDEWLLEPQMGPLYAEIHLLDESCHEITTWKSERGGAIEIESDGAASLLLSGDPGSFGPPADQVDACGAPLPPDY